MTQEEKTELSESDDERIRKALLTKFTNEKKHGGKYEIHGVSIDNIIAWLKKQSTLQVRTGIEWVNTIDDACDKRYLEEYANGEYCHEQSFKWGFYEGVEWLEKQGQKKYTFKSIPRLLDMIKPTSKAKAYCQKLINTLVKEGYFADAKIVEKYLKKMDGEDVPMAIMDEKQDKHKPSDKIEPKFHEGDWVVCEVTGSVYQIRNCIENLSNHKYGYLTNDGYYISTNEVNHYHLWDITKDVKDGDVLVVENIIFIYKRTLGGHIVSYCKLINNVFESWEDIRTCCEGNKYVHPATKEQCDLLFQKMKEAGYTFDFKKKELKNIERS